MFGAAGEDDGGLEDAAARVEETLDALVALMIALRGSPVNRRGLWRGHMASFHETRRAVLRCKGLLDEVRPGWLPEDVGS